MDKTVVNDASQHDAKDTPLFVDLAEQCWILTTSSVDERVQELAARLGEGVYITAVGGFPILQTRRELIWCDAPINTERIRREIKNGLGISGVLTYMNRSKLSLSKLGGICVDREHDWAFRWMTVSLLFVGYGHDAELAFTRDGRFFMSWPVTQNPTGAVFAATASIKDWLKYTIHYDDKSFDSITRRAMRVAHGVLKQILPNANREQHFLAKVSFHVEALSNLQLKGRKVLEIGVGHGELTQLILAREPTIVFGYEIEKGLCKLRCPGFFLIEEDIQNVKFTKANSACLIANPPYSLLPWLKEQLLPFIRDVLLLIPMREEKAFHELGFRSLAILAGDAFSPSSEGTHVLVQRGFDDR